MVTYSVFLALQFLMLLSGIVATVRLLFDIQTGLFDADVIPELAMYESDPWVRYKWDTLQSEFEGTHLNLSFSDILTQLIFEYVLPCVRTWSFPSLL